MNRAALCLVATGALGWGTAMATTSQDTMFVSQAALGGLAEVQAGRLAQIKATAPPVKEFAARMVADHMPNNQELSTLAASKGLTPPTFPDAQHKAELDTLEATAPNAFDAAYVENQILGHQQMQAVMEQEIQNGSDPALKDFAQKTLPVVQMHLQMARQLPGGGT